jgi:pimeloyl-ACP methyl ester carboxylesterase
MTLHVFDRVVVEDEGEGDAVVCVHGLGGSTNTFTPLMPALARQRVIRLDMPGSARSHRVEGPLTIERFVETLLSVCTRLNVTRAHWIGHSLGTIVCQHVAVAAPIIVTSSDPGNTPGVPFDISAGLLVTSNTAIDASTDVLNMFGATIGVSSPAATRFADRGAGQVDTVFFTTPAPVTVSGYNLWLVSSNEAVGGKAREVTVFQFFAGGNLISTVNIIPLGGTYLAAYGSEFIKVTTRVPLSGSNPANDPCAAPVPMWPYTVTLSVE